MAHRDTCFLNCIKGSWICRKASCKSSSRRRDIYIYIHVYISRWKNCLKMYNFHSSFTWNDEANLPKMSKKGPGPNIQFHPGTSPRECWKPHKGKSYISKWPPNLCEEVIITCPQIMKLPLCFCKVTILFFWKVTILNNTPNARTQMKNHEICDSSPQNMQHNENPTPKKNGTASFST